MQLLLSVLAININNVEKLRSDASVQVDAANVVVERGRLTVGEYIESGESFNEAVVQVKTFGLAGAFAWTFAPNLSGIILNMKHALV